MKLSRFAVGALLATLLTGGYAEGSSGSPLQKVVQLMTQLQGQVIQEGETQQQTYMKYSTWCEKTSKEKQFEIQDNTDLKSDLEAVIDKSKSDGEEAQARVEELSGGLATDSQDVKAITLIREKEKNEFEAMDKELSATITTISKARSVLKKELDKAKLKTSASFLQQPTKGMQQFTAALDALVTTSMGVSAESRDRLTELLEVGDESESDSSEEGEEGDGEADSSSAPPQIAKPTAPVYTAKSGGILDVLEKMEEEAQDSQDKCRRRETKEKHNYELLHQRLVDRIATQQKELEVQQKEQASAKETMATAKGKLQMTVRDLKEDQKFLKRLQQGCMERASEFESEVTTRNDELTALASAKKTVQAIALVQVPDSDSDRQQDEAQSAESFVQVGMEATTQAHMYALRTAGATVASRLKQLASDEHSVALAQLSSRVTTVLRRMDKKGAVMADPFKKVKNLIQNMIDKLDKMMAEDAQQKQFCDKEMAESKAAKLDREGTIEGLSTRIEEGVAEVAKLNQQRTMLLGEIKDIETSQGEMDELRQQEHAGYKKVSQELKEGLAAVQTALKVLRDFYSQSDDAGSSFVQDMGASMKTASSGQTASVIAATGGGGGTAIIGLLEVCESDFSKGVAEGEAEEDAASSEYEKLTQENKKERIVKDKTVSQITSDEARIKKKNAEFSGDRTETQQELSALMEYLEKLNKQCVAQPESYHDRVARRKREIEGLEQALDILVNQASPSEE